MEMSQSSSNCASTPKAASVQGKASFTTPRSAVTNRGGRTAAGSTKRLSTAFKSPMRHSDVTPAAEAETVDALLQDVNSLKQKDLLLADQIDQLHRQGYNEEELKVQIDCLHAYNEMKDIGQMLLGQLAVRQRVTTRDLYTQYGLELDD